MLISGKGRLSSVSLKFLPLVLTVIEKYVNRLSTDTKGTVIEN